jgi:hypothetical protein
MITSCRLTYLVTPAKAGVHHLRPKFQPLVMDSRLRGNDEESEKAP